MPRRRWATPPFTDIDSHGTAQPSARNRCSRREPRVADDADRHGGVVRAVVKAGRRFPGSPAGGACCVVVGVSGHDHREVPDHVHYHYRG